MKICYSSWHCRVLSNFTGGPLPKTLCAYFWMLMLALFFGTFLCAACTALGLVAIILFVSPIVTYGLPWLAGEPLADVTFHGYLITLGDLKSYNLPPFHTDLWFELFVFIPSMAVWALAGYIGFRTWEDKTAAGKRYAEKKRALRRVRREGVEPELPAGFWGVVFGYFRAVKSRVCPTIEYHG